MTIGSALDRLTERVRLTENLKIIEDARSVVQAMTVVIWGGVVQVAFSAVVLFNFNEPAAARAVVVGGILFAVSWFWLAWTGDLRGTVLIAVSAGAVNIFVHVALGGFAYSGGAVFFGLTLAASVALMLGKRAAVVAILLYALVGVVFGFIEETLRASRPPPDPALTNFLFPFILISNLAVVPPLIVYLLGKVRLERERAESLLLNMLPAEVARELKERGATTPQRFESMSVLFADIVGFTPLSTEMSPEKIVESLNEVFSHFDHLAERHGVEKIRTIGDSYMAASGVPVARDDHAHALAAMALDMLDYAGSTRFSFRIGINSGPVVAGVIGTHKFQYDVWGDTVNTAYRMESHGVTGRIQISEVTNALICGSFATTPRGPVEIKGKGVMTTWFLDGQRGHERATPHPL